MPGPLERSGQHVPAGTPFQSSGSRSTVPSVAHACLLVPQSFCPAFATP